MNDSFVENNFGVMQGRLLPKYQGRYQAHPKEYWQKEFEIAKKLGLDCIEFILDYNDAEQNPLLNQNGINEILSISGETGVVVKTICADYFMEAPLHSNNLNISIKSQQVLTNLLNNSALLGITDIVLPCVDQSSLNDEAQKARFLSVLKPIIPLVEELDINISLETDLPPISFKELLEKFNSDKISVNYDVGNSAALGFNPIDELEAYGNRITDIHIKDRALYGGPVILGNGNANFSIFLKKLKELNYKGPFIMQAYRDDEGLIVFEQQLSWIKEQFNSFYIN